jgi:hypothetical protein
MQKIAILLLTFLLFSPERINAQETIKELTNYKTDRKSLQLVASSDEYLLVDNGEFYLDVLTVNDEGQLYKYFESEIPYCIDGKTIQTDINDTHILFYYGDHIIFQNFRTGETRTVDNLPQFESDFPPVAYFVGSDYYGVSADSNYLYFLDNDVLKGIYEYGPYVKGDFLQFYKTVNNQFKFLIEYVPENKIFEFEEDDKIFYNISFPGFMYQHQPRSLYDNFSEEYVLYIVNQDGSVDSLNGLLPKLELVDKSKNGSSLLMLSEQRDENNWYQFNVFYKYDLTLDTLISLDTLNTYYFNDLRILTDTFYLFSDYESYIIGNLYTKEKIKIDVPTGTYFFDHVQSKLVFFDFNNAAYVYDYTNGTISKLTDVDILSYRNVNRLKTIDKAYYFDLEQLTFPLYEVSDSIYSHDQTIATSANQNGLRTSFLQKSDNFIYTFEDDGIVVLDTTVVDGYRKKKLINHKINLGCFEYGWHEYKDIVYGQIPIFKDGKKYYELVSVNLENLEVTNLTEDLGLLSFEGDLPTYVNGSNGFLFLHRNMIDIERQIVLDLTPYYSGGSTNEVLKFENKVILMKYDELIEFTYPALNHIRTIEVRSIKKVGEKYFIYNTTQNPDVFIFSDGSYEIEITDLMDFNYNNFYDYIIPGNALVMTNYKTNQLKMYIISNDIDGNLKVEKVYSKIFDDISYVFERHTEEYICFSVTSPTEEVAHFYNLATKTMTELKGRSVRKMLDIYNNQIVFLNDSLRKIEKVNLEGQVLKSLDYFESTRYLSPDYRSNNGHKGLYILDNSSFYRDSKLVFDSESFSYVYDSSCEYEFFTRTSDDNVVYKDSAYYFNLDTNEKGRQIYKLHNPYDTGTSPTTDGKISTFGLYPNPVTSALDIKTTEPCAIHSLKVYDYLGRSYPVLHQPCETTIQVDHLEQGAYIIELIEGTSRKVARFVKM